MIQNKVVVTRPSSCACCRWTHSSKFQS